MDLFALALAKKEEATLLTGDRNLRTAANNENVTVHGTLWLLDQLTEYRLISCLMAKDALSQMLKCRRRLTAAECKIPLNKWSKSDPS